MTHSVTTSYVMLNCDARGVVTLTLNRPDKRNAFDDSVIAQLHEAIKHIANDSSVRAVVLTGTGSAFCAGMDLDHMRKQGTHSPAENELDARAFANCLHSLDTLNKPVIARVNGGAFGGGVGLVACADIAIGSEQAKFALTEVRLGIVPAVISPFVIASIGPRQARRWFLSGDVMNAATAKHVGLLHEVVTATDLDAAVEREIALLLQGGPAALAAAKQLIRNVENADDRHPINTAGLLAQLRTSPEGQEGLAAFNEKRLPSWFKP
jgi:methylglutaconyl-CoA hydratase